MKEPLDWLTNAPIYARDTLAHTFDEQERAEFTYHWALFARSAQLPPSGDWRVWLVLAGRGFGKTRAGSEWVRSIAESNPKARIALVATSLAEARAVMVEGESGILACCPPERRPVFESSLRRLKFANGAQAQLFSASEPDALRGPQHSHAWCDEIGKWPLAHDRATRCWDNLLMGMRLCDDPRITATTTPRSVPLIRRLLEKEDEGATAVTRGNTYENSANLPDRFLTAIKEEFGNSQLARQEIAGELLKDVEGALWNRALLEQSRTSPNPAEIKRVVVAVDPPASSNGDACGIIAVALGIDGKAYVLADCSIEKPSPEQWARRVALTAEEWAADRVVAEANQGGSMVASVLRAANHQLPIKLVHASRSKAARAEPIAALYETGRVKHCGHFPQLEDEMCNLKAGGEYAGAGRSPDRADALVWGLTELLLGRASRPRVLSI